MRFDSWLLEISATPAYLLLAFLLLLLVMHICLVWLLKLDDHMWKRMDYVWLGAAVLGLVASSGEAERFLSKSYLDNLEAPRTSSSYRYLRNQIESGAAANGFLCMTRTKSPMSPPNFDRIVEAQQSLCRWSQDTFTKMRATVEPPFPTLEETGYIPVPTSYKDYEPFYVSEIQKRAEDYGANLGRHKDRAMAAQKSLSDQILTVLGPLVVAFALALRVTKVSGELSNAKKNA